MTVYIVNNTKVLPGIILSRTPEEARNEIQVAPPHPGLTPNYYYFCGLARGALTNVTITADLIYYIPMWLPSCTITRLGTWVVTGGVGGTLIKLGLYDSNGSIPGSLVVSGGNVAGDSAAEVEATISQALDAGLYYLAIWSDGAPLLRACSSLQTSSIIGSTDKSTYIAQFTQSLTFTMSFPATATPAISSLTSTFNNWVRNVA